MTRIVILILTFNLILLGCNTNNKPETKNNMFGLFKKQEPIETFWNWFRDNEKRLRNQSNTDSILNEIIAKGRIIREGLAFELEPPRNGIINLTISADGVKDLFPVVQSIVDKAPKIEGWNIIAFRQRINPEQAKGLILKADNHELNTSEMKFFPIISGDTLDIIIFAIGVTEENRNQVAYGGLIILDNLIGEYDCVTKVRSFDFQNMPSKKEELDQLKPLIELPKYIDNFHSNRR